MSVKPLLIVSRYILHTLLCVDALQDIYTAQRSRTPKAISSIIHQDISKAFRSGIRELDLSAAT